MFRKCFRDTSKSGQTKDQLSPSIKSSIATRNEKAKRQAEIFEPQSELSANRTSVFFTSAKLFHRPHIRRQKRYRQRIGLLGIRTYHYVSIIVWLYVWHDRSFLFSRDISNSTPAAANRYGISRRLLLDALWHPLLPVLCYRNLRYQNTHDGSFRFRFSCWTMWRQVAVVETHGAQWLSKFFLR